MILTRERNFTASFWSRQRNTISANLGLSEQLLEDGAISKRLEDLFPGCFHKYECVRYRSLSRVEEKVTEDDEKIRRIIDLHTRVSKSVLCSDLNNTDQEGELLLEFVEEFLLGEMSLLSHSIHSLQESSMPEKNGNGSPSYLPIFQGLDSLLSGESNKSNWIESKIVTVFFEHSLLRKTPTVDILEKELFSKVTAAMVLEEIHRLRELIPQLTRQAVYNVFLPRWYSKWSETGYLHWKELVYHATESVVNRRIEELQKAGRLSH